MADAVEAADLFSNRKIRSAMILFRKSLSEIAHTRLSRGLSREDAILILQNKMARLKCKDVDPDDVLEHMLKQKVICVVKGLIAPYWCAKKRTPDEARAAFDNVVADLSTRATDNEQAQTNLARLIRRATRLHAVHRIQTPRGRGVFMGSRMNYTDGEPSVTMGTAFIIERNQVAVYRLFDGMIKLTWIDDYPLFDVDLEHAFLDECRTWRMRSCRLVADNSNSVISAAADESYRGLKRLLQDREGVQSYIGIPLIYNRWLSLSMSLNRHKSIGRTAQMALAGMLDPELRRIALRNPFASYDFYFWVADADRETIRRRAQMSEAYPMFTCYMKLLDDVIQIGSPLLPAIQDITNLDIPRLKQLRGMHWQRLGRAVRYLISEYGDNNLLMKRLQEVDPARMPKSRPEWVAYCDLHQWDLLNLISEGRKPKAWEAFSKNWSGYGALISEDLLHAVNDTAENIVTLIDHHLSMDSRPSETKRQVMIRILTHVAGDNFGIKRLRQFNEAWHKGTGQRSVKMRALKKKVFGVDGVASWKPLTEKMFECHEGRMIWLTDELALEDEGRLMAHCVGSYWHRCVEGVSHIAQVLANDETRSTVEIRISTNGKASVSQNYTYKNKAPSKNCQTVVAKFIKAHAKTKFQVLRGDAGNRSNIRRAMVPHDIVEELKDIFSDCLSPDFMDALETEFAEWRTTNVRMSVEEYERMALEKRSLNVQSVAKDDNDYDV